MFNSKLLNYLGKIIPNSKVLKVNITPTRSITLISKNKRAKKRRGEKVEDGNWVSAGTILVRQLGLKYFPGLNVGLGRTRDLYAMEHGYVYKTTERVKPDWNNRLMYNFFGQYENHPEIPIYKTYFHVIPKPMPQVFKLVDQI